MDKIKSYFQNFMMGRYGIDQFSQTLFIAALIFIVLATFGGNAILEFIGIGLFIYSYYRVLSRDISSRSAENTRYREAIYSLKEKLGLSGDKTHRIYTCPNKSCKQKIRVPKGKGNIEITCPKCGKTFRKHT